MVGCARHHVENRIAIVGGCRNVEEAEFIGTSGIVGLRRFDGISGIDKIDKIDALDDSSVLDVETGNNTSLQWQARAPRIMASASTASIRPS